MPLTTEENSPVVQKCPQPLHPTRLLNLVGRFRRPIVMDPEEMLRRAEAATGFTDWGEDPFTEGLEEFCRSINDDSNMHYAGRLMTRMGVEKWLTDRLRIEKTLQAEPGIAQRPIEKPILIPGWLRSGTTFLHRLLATDSSFRTTRSWEVYFPVPPPDPATYDGDPRIAQTEKLYRTIFRTSPALAAAHPMRATWPEECWYLLDRSFVRVLPAAYYDIPSYRRWLFARSTEELVPAYKYHRKQIQILQWRFPGAQWLLKSPIHGMLLEPFHAVYPDARYIFCHRDPLKMAASASSLVASRKSAFYPQIDLRTVSETALEFIVEATRRAMAVRERIRPERCLDLSFSKLVDDPLREVRKVYAWLEWDFHPEVGVRMEDFISEQKRGQHTAHRYDAAQFGLNRERIEEGFRDYRHAFEEYL